MLLFGSIQYETGRGSSAHSGDICLHFRYKEAPSSRVKPFSSNEENDADAAAPKQNQLHLQWDKVSEGGRTAGHTNSRQYEKW